MAVIAAVSTGGAAGALARYGISVAWPHRPDGFPWSTWTINVSGCLLIGVLMILKRRVVDRPASRPPLPRRRSPRRVTRPSPRPIVDVQQAAAHGAPGVAACYLGATVVGAMLAVWIGATANRLGGQRPGEHEGKR
jgi:CrcB protein